MARYDFNDAGDQTGGLEAFPPGVYKLKTYLRQGGAGEEGVLRTSKNSLSHLLDFEFTVQGGSYGARKLWENWVFEPTEDNDKPADGLLQAIEITRAKIKALLNSAHGLNTADKSEEAQKKRSFESLLDLDGLVFVARVSIKSQPGTGYRDKNIIQEILTPDDKQWFSFMAQDQVRQAGEEGQAKAKPVERKGPSGGGGAPPFDDEIPFGPLM
jgi:hypothetical protein